jgi:hypothetical protein
MSWLEFVTGGLVSRARFVGAKIVAAEGNETAFPVTAVSRKVAASVNPAACKYTTIV